MTEAQTTYYASATNRRTDGVPVESPDDAEFLRREHGLRVFAVTERPMTDGSSMSRADAAVVAWTPADGPPRRIRFEPHDGPGGEFERVESVREADGWREAGREFVNGVFIEGDTDA